MSAQKYVKMSSASVMDELDFNKEGWGEEGTLENDSYTKARGEMSPKGCSSVRVGVGVWEACPWEWEWVWSFSLSVALSVASDRLLFSLSFSLIASRVEEWSLEWSEGLTAEWGSGPAALPSKIHSQLHPAGQCVSRLNHMAIYTQCQFIIEMCSGEYDVENVENVMWRRVHQVQAGYDWRGHHARTVGKSSRDLSQISCI